jgi:hydroxyacylglutathione hydrolase
MAKMHASLSRLSALDPDTRLYVGHEYTEANLRFAAHVEPESAAIRERLEKVRAARAAGHPSVPGTMRDEHATNPFLRSHVEEVAAFARARGSAPDEVEVFAQVREAKNSF